MRLILGIAAALALSACSFGGLPTPPTSPGQVAQHTTADEQARLRCEQGYKLSRTIGELGVDAGLVRGQLATRAADLDRKLFDGLQICRTAYRAFNSTGLIQAADQMDTLAGQVTALFKGDSR